MPDPLRVKYFLCGTGLAVLFVIPFSDLLFGVCFYAEEEEEE
jgi:ABC-type protease/lipase transport system fused ATPase/permease subunit